MDQLFDCKDDVDLNDLKELQPACWTLLTAALLFCKEHNIILVISSIKSDRKNVTAVSTTHEEGRAIDISTKGWPAVLIHRFCHHINRSYGDVAAVSRSDNIPRAALYHDAGFGSHVHLQCRRDVDMGKYITRS